MVTAHDDLFHSTFQHARHAIAWLVGVLPAAIADAIAWATLRPAPEKLRGHALRLSVADLVFRAEQRTHAPVWLVVEHKATHDAAVARQLLRYVVHLGDRIHGPDGPTPVVAILLHHGEAPFAVQEERSDGPFAAVAPRQPLIVDDLALASEASLRARTLTPLGALTLLCLRFLRGQSGDEALLSFERWADLMRAADRDDPPPSGHDAIAAIACYALCVVDVPHQDLHDTFERLLQRPEETIMSTAEKLRREGFEQGRAETLLRQLHRRFGPLPAEVTARIRLGTLADLDLWTDRVLDARTFAELFGD